MIITTQLKSNEFIRIVGNPVIQSLDGEFQARLRTILHESWTPAEREAYGIYQVEIDPPEGEQFNGIVDNVDGEPVPLYSPMPEPEPVMGVLKLDKFTLIANNEDTITATFGSEQTVHFIVDGEVYSIEPENKVATATITANAPGAFTISAEGQSFDVVALEANE